MCLKAYVHNSHELIVSWFKDNHHERLRNAKPSINSVLQTVRKQENLNILA